MCRTVHSLLQTVICSVQMLVRVFMTTILMLENLIRMILQTLYNFISFMLQLLSLIPICLIFLVTARLKCFMCGGGGACPVNRGGACDCLLSAVAIIIMFFIFRATGILDKIFFSLGYDKARPIVYTFVPTPGDITECSRNDTDYTDVSKPNLRFLQDDEWTELYISTYLDVTEQTSGSTGDSADSITLGYTNKTYAKLSVIDNSSETVISTGVPSAG
ncbi:uncharacterized protein LOC120625865 [Pararge aegeria]|uniref:uncharacterized protein LOC120625865 n=1 Tax=Pararge aegeria TaxID=116150 RepID=UPI0019D29E76|nr:uncharacterized protein LOC120625865 [Pararge aegeria]